MAHIVEQLACNGWGVSLNKITLWINKTTGKKEIMQKGKLFPLEKGL